MAVYCYLIGVLQEHKGVVPDIVSDIPITVGWQGQVGVKHNAKVGKPTWFTEPPPASEGGDTQVNSGTREH